MTQGMGINDFLNHSGHSKGALLKGWTKRAPPAINTWLHTRSSIVALYRHGFPRIVVREDRDTRTQVVHVWSQSWNCHEHEKVLKAQYKRDDETGERKLPPASCGMCKMIEWVYQQVACGNLSWTEPMFHFAGDDPKETVTIHAGGLYNAFGARDLSPEQKLEMKGAGIFLKDAWKENAMTKLSYAMVVVDDDDPAAGPQIAVESALLGDKVKGVIRDQMEGKGEEQGNPLINPYCIRWTHHPKEENFQKKFHALRYDQAAYRPEIAEQIIDADLPDMTQVTRKFSPTELRALVEKYALFDLPLDEFFGPADAAPEEQEAPPANIPSRSVSRAAARPAAPAPAARPAPPPAGPRRPPQAAAPAAPAPTAPPAPRRPPVAAKAKECVCVRSSGWINNHPPGTKQCKGCEGSIPVEQVACDGCGAAMDITATVCAACGHSYEEQQEEATPPPPPPKLPTRAEAKAAAAGGKQAPLPPRRPAAPPAPPAEEDPERGAIQDPPVEDDLPFLWLEFR